MRHATATNENVNPVLNIDFEYKEQCSSGNMRSCGEEINETYIIHWYLYC